MGSIEKRLGLVGGVGEAAVLVREASDMPRNRPPVWRKSRSASFEPRAVFAVGTIDRGRPYHVFALVHSHLRPIDH